MNFQGILDGIKKSVGGLFQPKLISPIPDERNVYRVMFNKPSPSPIVQKPMTTPTATPAPRGNVLGARSTSPVTEEQIRRGWDNYGDGNAPAASMSGVFAEVANQYPVLRQHPGLLPAMAMKETSGGKASQNKNWFNWGIYDDAYQETDPAEVIRDVARAIGSDEGNSSHYYEKFRDTGNIRDMLDRYAPPTENDTNLYHKQLLDWMKMFQ